ncbi:uncharacterized protein KY384_007156 [Bacidia gigantensis]|uniref:uncharacterized protein n=1 Tax=Bacidia gigantensis TaxID=2732470 RepID=UPI001D05B68F|nr:uncharacterized protein KY384_007156 [Bacidia gigantensis]KAG8528239.1 hypothetical protein KY384_007156 [Bacidia gigantensis]
MAYSPSPHPGAGPSLALSTVIARSRLHQRSATPPPQQSLNKRDKKRMAMAERLSEISNNFAENRDAFFRERLRGYQADINFINNAQLYNNKPLDDAPLEQPAEHDFAVASQSQASLNRKNQPLAQLGKHAASFVHEVNAALEEKDTKLVETANNFNFTIEHLQKDYQFAVAVAEAEHRRLMDVLRQRLVASVQAKKAALQRDKEKLDIADTNALLYHPNQFSINNAASPGGPQGNRKTRHTRHRLEIDDLDLANAINGKRKRKAPVDGEIGSPLRESDLVNGNKAHEFGQEDQPPPMSLHTIDRLFTDKEMITHVQAAHFEVLEQWQASKRRKHGDNSAALDYESESDTNKTPPPNLGGDGTTDDKFLEAPSMERTATNQSYATRSMRTHNLINGASRETLGELAGRERAAELLGTYVKEKKKDDEYMRTSSLTNEEMEQDAALYARAMKAEDRKRPSDAALHARGMKAEAQRRPSDASLLDEVAGERPDHVKFPKINGGEI